MRGWPWRPTESKTQKIKIKINKTNSDAALALLFLLFPQKIPRERERESEKNRWNATDGWDNNNAPPDVYITLNCVCPRKENETQQGRQRKLIAGNAALNVDRNHVSSEWHVLEKNNTLALESNNIINEIRRLKEASSSSLFRCDQPGRR